MTKRSWRLIALLGILTLLLSGMGAHPALPAVALATGRVIAPTATTAVLNETFESGALPTGWQVTGTPGWTFNNPGSRSNGTGGTGKFAIADSDVALWDPMDATLSTPTLNLSGANVVRLSFKAEFLVEKNSTADADVSVDNGTTWTNVWRQTGASFRGATTLNVPQAVGQSSVIFRFHYYNARYSWWFALDDVRVEAVVPPTAPGSLSAVVSSNKVLLSWTDTNSDEDASVIEQSADGVTGWAKIGQVDPNVTTFSPADTLCGTTAFYRVKATSGALQSGYSNTANLTMPACPSAVSGINENFNAAASLPTGWTTPGIPWAFDGTKASAEAAGGVRELRTPVFSMSGTSAVLLTFQADIKIYSGQQLAQDANVEISTDEGTNWTNVWSKQASYNGPVVLDLSPWAANRPSVIVRFLSRLPYTGSYWRLDDVVIGTMPAPSTPTGLAVTLNGGSDVLLAWRGSTGSKYKVERSNDSGSTWTQIADITDGATSYVDTSVASVTAYTYRVRAYNAAGTSAFSASASTTTGDRTKRYLDVTISLHAGAVLATPADREKYENNIRYFADALYEESNGVHILRKVTFYRDGANFNSAHVQWIPTCHPNATLSGYVQPGTGARMEFCDKFGNFDFLATTEGQQGGGATLAHEWGHFFYGLPDEYSGSGDENSPISVPRTTDVNSSVSIMRYQWDGFTDHRFLNHTTSVTGFSLQTASGRVYGAPAWEVLARPKNQDPQNSVAASRPFWPELAAVAPAPGVAPRIDLPNAAARASLQIVWEPGFPAVAGQAVAQAASHAASRVIVIDRSAPMDESGYLDDAKAAAADMIRQTPIGDSLGIIAVDGTATVVQPLTTLVDETTKDTLIAALNGITAGDAQLATGDALQQALSALTAVGAPDSTSSSVYLISQGSGTTGTHALMTVPGFESAAIPLYIFGFDPSQDDETELRQLAELTKGKYTTVRTADELGTALNTADQDTSAYRSVQVAHNDANLAAGQTYTVPITSDATLHDLGFDITYLAKPVSATLTLIDPLGAQKVVDPNDCETYDLEGQTYTSCYIEHPALAGTWKLEVQADSDMYLEYYVTGIIQPGTTTYEANVWAKDGDTVSYPEPIVMYASVNRGDPIAGLKATGVIYEADGQASSVTFHDDGQAPDTIADDGIYSAYVDYAGGGEHDILVQFDNPAGKAFYTDKSFGDQDDTPDVGISEHFARGASYQVSVLDWREDDHVDWPDDPKQAPTPLTVDNVQVPGRIDARGDVDVFQVTVPMNYAKPTMAVRINSLGLGMDPSVVVSAADYSWEFEESLDYTPTSDDYLFFSLDVKPGESFYIKVRHYDDEAETGTYSISAGPDLWSDPVSESASKVIHTQFLPILKR